MRIALVGADFEENLGVGMIAAAAHDAGHEVSIIPFDLPEDLRAVSREVVAERPDVVGLAMQFQHRADEFLRLARRLRSDGFAGHLTCGGQFPTLAWTEVLGHDHGVDSVVLHEGERTIVELLEALASGSSPEAVPGLALRGEDGVPARTIGRRLIENLDELPLCHRYRPHARHCGVPFIPLMGGRGCWGACTYCSITSFYRDARAHGGGRTLRQRSPENVASEMALLAHRAGGSAVFCFHDDNFLLPRPADSLERVARIRAALDGWDVGRVGMIGKCRPDSMTPDLAERLRELGVLRLYVGVENASQHGSDNLNRRNQTRRVSDALAACRDAGIFVCYNLLLFEPDASLDDVRENVAFMRDHADHPVNFCRAEPYYGTPLQRSLEERQSLGGSYLGFNYRIEDDRTELLFRICSAAFRQRNFDPAGVANRSMGLGYSLKLLEHFYEDPHGRRSALQRRVEHLTRAIVTETAGFLETALALVDELSPGEHDLVARHTALLGMQIAAADRERHAALDELYADLEAFGLTSVLPEASPVPARRLATMAGSVALGASLALLANACDGVLGSRTVDPVPIPVADPPPPDHPVKMVPIPPDPVPPDPTVVDPVPIDPDVVDPVPTDDSQTTMRRRRRHRLPPPPDPLPPPHDPVPIDPTPGDPAPPVVDPVPSPKTAVLDEGVQPVALPSPTLIDQWRDTTSRAAIRSADLPLHAPPRVALSGWREGSSIVVQVEGADGPLSLRWEACGALEGEGRVRRWTPGDPDDQVTVAARTAGGVAVTSLRARDV